ncbi:MAG: DUF2752 domain-containing protein [Lachnospiraceae bacterium]|nr:DUF2752 domain-containing protein [Lachnospiraceae bacterium]
MRRSSCHGRLKRYSVDEDERALSRRYMKAVAGRLWADIKEYGMAGVVFLVYMAAVNRIFHAFCPSVVITGFPCPGCGLTRAAGYLLIGRVRQAWEMNPVIFPIAAAAVYFGVSRYLLGRRVRGIKGLLIIVLILLCVVFCIRMYLYFPNKAPCVYQENNLLERTFPFYKKMLHEWGII